MNVGTIFPTFTSHRSDSLKRASVSTSFCVTWALATKGTEGTKVNDNLITVPFELFRSFRARTCILPISAVLHVFGELLQ